LQFKKHLQHLVKTKLVAAKQQRVALTAAALQQSVKIGKSKASVKLPVMYLPTVRACVQLHRHTARAALCLGVVL
jgi:hypothetical protein